MWASPILGGLIVLTRKKSRLFAWLCGIVIILVAFSRMYLGVHTPQDVICGTIAGLLAVWLASFIMNPLVEMLTKRWAYMVIGFLTMFWAIFVWPCVIRLTQGKK